MKYCRHLKKLMEYPPVKGGEGKKRRRVMKEEMKKDVCQYSF